MSSSCSWAVLEDNVRIFDRLARPYERSLATCLSFDLLIEVTKGLIDILVNRCERSYLENMQHSTPHKYRGQAMVIQF